jgi:hypothetical protein
MRCMKRIAYALLFVIVLAIACTKDTVTEYYTFFRPVYKTKEAVKANIRNDVPQSIQQTGKLVWKDNFVYLNDVDKGIHILDISDPSNIKAVSFISIPGCVDIAINDHYLYADCYTDLVTIDIADPLHTAVKQFLPGVFPHRYYNNFQADTGKVIQEWVRVDTVVKRRFSETVSFPNFDGRVLFSSSSFAPMGVMSAQKAFGIAGSTARFALMNQRMYTVSNADLKVFNIATAAAPSYVKALPLSNGNIETIFPYQDKLFIGSQTGMFIYDAKMQDQPQKLGQFTHVRSCDPVIADNNYAYVTLKGGGFCGGNSNQLDVLDVSNLMSPQLIKTYPLSSPSGLSKDGDILLICDGMTGLKIFNAAKANAISLLKQVAGFEAADVIAQNGVALVTAKDGIRVIDYSDPLNAKEISKILVAQK